jgi:hypothetical protein
MHGYTLQVPGLGKISVRMEAGGAEVNVSRTDAVVVRRIHILFHIYTLLITNCKTLQCSASCTSQCVYERRTQSDASLTTPDLLAVNRSMRLYVCVCNARVCNE